MFKMSHYFIFFKFRENDESKWDEWWSIAKHNESETWEVVKIFDVIDQKLPPAINDCEEDDE